MGSFKKLNLQDVFVVPYTSRKSWNSLVDDLDVNSFTKKIAITGSTSNLFAQSVGYEQRLNYQSINHLYYSNFVNFTVSGSNENYIQSTLENGTRNLQDKAIIFSLSKEVTGEAIEPSSFIISYSSGSEYGTIYDNGEGKLLLISASLESFQNPVGDIIYTHGMGIVTDQNLFNILENIEDFDVSWESNLTLYTKNIYCKLRDYEFNISQNPSTLTGSFGTVKTFATGSDFRPYVTSIGLYNDSSELIAVGKFGQPVPKLPFTDMTFVIKLDM